MLRRFVLVGQIRHELDGFHLLGDYGLDCIPKVLKRFEALSGRQALEIPPLHLYWVELWRVCGQKDKHDVATGRLDEFIDLCGPVS